MVMLNDLDRFHLVIDVIDRVPSSTRVARHTCDNGWSTRGCGPGTTPNQDGEDDPGGISGWTWHRP